MRSTLPIVLWTAATALAPGCASDPASPHGVDAATWSSWQSCGQDASCQATLVQATLKESGDGAVGLVQSIPQEEQRWVVVSRSVHAEPAYGAVLCATLDDSDLRERCISDTSRPHLYRTTAPKPSRAVPRTAPGPTSSTLLLNGTAPSRLQTTAPSLNDCDSSGNRTSCLTARAAGYAKEGNAEAAAAACLAIPDASQWQGECAFRSAEVVARDAPDASAAGAVELCLLARQWVGRCVEKIHDVAARRAPSADGDRAAWMPTLERWASMDTVWAHQSPSVRDVVRDHFWAAVVTRSYHLVDQPTGDPLDHLPEAAVPHIHAAAAYAMLQEQMPAGASLASVQRALDEVLRLRAEPGAHLLENPPRELPRTDYWAEDTKTDGGLPAVHYLRISRRIVSKDVGEDRTIAVLEAAARRGTTWKPLLGEGLASEHTLVVTTARRLREATRR